MTIQQLHNPHYDWKHVIDLDTLWTLMFSAAVLGSSIFALLSISQNSSTPFR